MNIADGTYAARPGAASVYESDKGALVLALVVSIENGPELKSYHTLVNRDGSINTRTVENLKAWSGWDGVDPFWFMANDLSGVDVEIVLVNEPGFQDPNKLFPKVKWVNPPGGGHKMPGCADRSAILAKYGAKFRAVAGGVPCPAGRPTAEPVAGVRVGAVGAAGTGVPTAPGTAGVAAAQVPVQAAAQATVQAAGPVVTPPPSAPPMRPVSGAKVVTVATQASAWNRLCTLGANLTVAERENIWFAAVDATGLDQVDMTTEGWAQVLAAIEARFAQAGGAVVAEQPEDDLAF